jgi:hypothetical protein
MRESSACRGMDSRMRGNDDADRIRGYDDGDPICGFDGSERSRDFPWPIEN